MVRYFLNILRYRLSKCTKHGKQKSVEWDVSDLQLWIMSLEQASQEGININNINFTKTSDFGVTDACETGIGGFIDNGVAWRWKLLDKMQGKLLLKFLDFFTIVVNIWYRLTRKGRGGTVLDFTNNPSALGWLHKFVFNPIMQPHHNKIARKLAQMLL